VRRSYRGPRAVPAAEMSLRDARSGDIDAILEIERASFPDPPWSRHSFVALLDNPRVSFTVASTENPQSAGGAADIVLGYVVTWIVADEAEIANLAVRPDRRRMGIGRMLLEASISAALSRGAESVYLDVRESNVAARALYEARGFAAVGRRVKYYRNPIEDALVLRWQPR
jgi:[ribosomal protein S18]-alanine N-acetyltransferase